MATKKIRVCVTGAGAAGLCAARHLAGDLNAFEPIIFEKTSDVGGTWVYSDKIGVDEDNIPIHTSMYKNLRTNLPKEVMELPDFRKMGGDGRSCVTHQTVLAYLKDYANHFQLRRFIQFNTVIENVVPDGAQDECQPTKWNVRVRNTKTSETREIKFDAVMVCNGHYSVPNIPDIPGIKSFPGKVLHSHDYRKPDDLSGKTVVVLGAQSSGIDISVELSSHASRIYLSHNGERITSKLPKAITEVSGVDKIEGHEFILKDGSTVTADTLLFCTGYLYSYPFLDRTCGINVDNNYVTPLYKHLINIDYPSMCLLGIPSIVVPFPMFHMQAQYFLALLQGKARLPSVADMLEDSKLKSTKKNHAHKLANAQWPYNDSLAQAGGFDPLPPLYKLGYEAWHNNRKDNGVYYKNYNLIISEDGNSVEIKPIGQD